MKAATYSYSHHCFDKHETDGDPDNRNVQLVLGFGAKSILATETIYDSLRRRYPIADIVLCSTSGEISGRKVLDDTVSVTAIEFERTLTRTASVNIEDFDNNSYVAGMALASSFDRSADLCYIMVLSDGGKVNGSELVSGINQHVQYQVPVTGGLAGDGSNFISTLTGLNKEPVIGEIVAIAFYSRHLAVSHGSMGGWEMFGPERVVTQSTGNRLYGINDDPALDVYKKYLGPYAKELPGSSLLFPLSVRPGNTSEPVVRTILSIDPVSKSMVFAGDVPEGSTIRLMKGNFDKLIDAASKAATQALPENTNQKPSFALLISCVGRKIILGDRVDEEVEAVAEIFGDDTILSGFYSYGEISPIRREEKCELHNQTMTITTFFEK